MVDAPAPLHVDAGPRSAQLVLSEAGDLAALTGLALEPSHGDEALTPRAVRAVVAASLGVDIRELRSLSPDGARVALDRLNEIVRRLAERAATDELTGALRRGAGWAAAHGEIARARRTGARLVLAVVDVDGLKQVNDTRGHLAGDAVLRTVATELLQGLRSYDTVIRFGGDEFICILGGITGAKARARLATLSRRVARRLPGESLSVGVDELRPDDSLDDLIRRADAHLYAGRKRRRGPR